MTRAGRGGRDARGGDRGRALPPLCAVALALWLLGCASEEPPAPAPAPSAAPVAAASVRLDEEPPAPSASAAPLGPSSASNPLGLPPHPLTLGARKRVFAVPERVLAGARLGSTLILAAATAVGPDGDELLVEGSAGSGPYRIHGAYVIPVPDGQRIVPGDAVITEHNGTLRHAVVTRLVKDRVGLRYTDGDTRAPEAVLWDARMIEAREGLHPGNYAARRDGDSYRHVLLVSSFGAGADEKWLALGYGGAAMVVPRAELVPIPVRYEPKVGTEVWGEWVGTLRKGAVVSSPERGFYVVKFERSGPPVTLGWGLLLPPVTN